MSNASQQTTSARNGILWGSTAQDWADIQEPACRPVYVAVFDRLGLRSNTLYLDAGCGAGLAAQLAAQRGAIVSGLDASEKLLAIATRRVPTADFQVGELQALPFPDGTFDLVTGFNAFQYATDPVAALAEAKRVVKPGGTVVVMTWGPPQGMEAALLLAALRPLLPPPPSGAPGPFALSDETALRNFAVRAGLQAVDVFDVDSPWHYADLSTALRGLASSGVAARAREHVGSAKVDEAHTVALAPFRQQDGSYRVGANFRCLVARS